MPAGRDTSDAGVTGGRQHPIDPSGPSRHSAAPPPAVGLAGWENWGMRRRSIGALVIMLAVGPGCWTDQQSAEQASGQTVPAPASFETTAKARPTPQELCDSSVAIRADIDGDGRLDRAYHTYINDLDGARLGVCTAAGQVDEIDGAGQAEGEFKALEIEQDGRSELAYGATTVGESLVALAVFAADHLHTVMTTDDNELILAAGWKDEKTGTAWGCDKGRGGQRDLVQVVVHQHGATAEWSRDTFRLSGLTATHTGVTRGSGPKQGYPQEQAASLVQAC
jgi:hypothetical protein